MTAKTEALKANKNLKAKHLKNGRWQVFDGDKPYAQDSYSPQTAWSNAEYVAKCPFKVGDKIRHTSGKIYTVVGHTTIGCVNHIIDENGITEGLYEWKYDQYEVIA